MYSSKITKVQVLPIHYIVYNISWLSWKSFTGIQNIFDIDCSIVNYLVQLHQTNKDDYNIYEVASKYLKASFCPLCQLHSPHQYLSSVLWCTFQINLEMNKNRNTLLKKKYYTFWHTKFELSHHSLCILLRPTYILISFLGGSFFSTSDLRRRSKKGLNT